MEVAAVVAGDAGAEEEGDDKESLIWFTVARSASGLGFE